MSEQFYQIDTGTLVRDNPYYIVVVSGTYSLNDLVPCRRVIDTNGPICAFLASSVLGYVSDIPEVNE